MRKIILATVSLFLFVTACNAKSAENNNPVSNDKEVESRVKTIHLTKAEFLERVVNYEENPEEWVYLGDKPAIIDFYADWCPPCRIIAPILEELAGEYEDDIYIYKIDTEKEQELAAVFGIRSLPSILFVPMGEQPQMVAGALPKESFEEAIQDILLKQ
jgi:thioredoxin